MSVRVEVKTGNVVDRGRNKAYHAGESFPCSAEEARRLVRLDVCRMIPEGESDSGGADKEQRLIEVIGTLDPDKEEHFTKSGVPQIPMLAEALGDDVSAEERDSAWAAYKAKEMGA